MSSFNAPQPFQEGDLVDFCEATQIVLRVTQRLRYGDDPFQGQDDPFIFIAAARFVRATLPSIGRYAESQMKTVYRSGLPNHRKSAK